MLIFSVPDIDREIYAIALTICSILFSRLVLIINIFTSGVRTLYATSLPPTLLLYSEIDKVFEKWYYAVAFDVEEQNLT